MGRIRDRTTFAELRRSGHRSRRGLVSVVWLPGPERPFEREAGPERRAAYSVGRPVGGAVVRNRVRRRLRALIRDEAPRLAPGAYLVHAAPAAARAGFDELRAALQEALGELGARAADVEVAR